MCKNNNLVNKNNILVTVMIVARNSENFIEMSLNSLIEQDFPQDKYEILFIDGMSEDATYMKAKYVLSNTKVAYRLFKNPKKTLASGWNLGIKEARGKYVARIDAHVWAYPDYISKSLATINKISDVCCVGGKAETISTGKNGKLISKILSSPFGVGNSNFRTSHIAQYSDTAACGLYKKSIFEKVGYFDETLVRSQDTELHARITEYGNKFYFNPEIRLKYYARNTIGKLIKQGWLNGYWNIHVWKKNKKALMLRHLIPLFFVTSLLMLLALTLFDRAFGLILLFEIIIYLVLSFYFSYKSTHKLSEIFKMMLIIFIFHLLYGLGSLKGILLYFFI